jgi:hypothetical protein
MKNLVKAFIAIFTFGLLLASCAEPCEKIECENGTCEGDGNCLCQDYYQQDADGICTVAINTLLEGTYTAQSTCINTGSFSETLQVDAGSNPNEVIVRNFQGAANNDITLALDTNDDVTVNQSTSQPDYTGSGTLSGSVFSFSLYSPTDSCQVTLTKQ